MSKFAMNFSLAHRAPLIVATLAVISMCTHGSAQVDVGPPDFSPSSTVGWIAYTVGEFIPPPSGPGPVQDDPDHPFVSNLVSASTGQQPTFQVADLSNPILQPWSKEELRKRNEYILSGKPGYARQVSCWPMGVPAFLLYPVNPVYIIQAPKEVLMTWQEDHMIRRIFLNVPHSARVKPSWFGESVGHYEGDTLVVDTIGMNDRTYIDNYWTPHTNQLHVIERFRMIDGGKALEVKVHVEDPGAFTTPWDAIQRYRRVEQGPMIEQACAENNTNHFDPHVGPIPRADKPDF